MGNCDQFKTLLGTVHQRFDTISNADNTLDQKAGTLMGFGITLIIGYLTLISPQLQGVKLIEGLIGVATLAISVILSLIVNWPRSYANASVKLSTNQEYLNKDEEALLLQLISDEEVALEKNFKILNKKVMLYKISTKLLILGGLLLILSKMAKFYV